VSEFAAHILLAVGLTGTALVVSLAAERLRIPYSVALLVVGIAVSPFTSFEPLFTFPQGLLFVFLPALIFEAALHLDPRALLRMWRPIAMLAIPGTLFTALLVALGSWALTGLDFAPAFVLGAIVSATDPVAVIAIFRRLTVPLGLQTIVEAESLANDGVALLLYAIGIDVAASGHVSWSLALAQALFAVVAGVAVGVVFAYLYARLLYGMIGAEYYAAGSLVLAYGSYLVASGIHASGIFACAAAGVAVGLFKQYAPPVATIRDLEGFWGALALLGNSLVFLFMGFALDLRRVLSDPLEIMVAIASVVVARAALAYGGLWLTGIRSRGWPHVVAWAGLRGGLALALALNLPRDLPARDAIVGATFAVVLVTLVTQGLTIEPLLRRLKLEI
jgi:monovalent cation:H+ antiporter, CPA1 family